MVWRVHMPAVIPPAPPRCAQLDLRPHSAALADETAQYVQHEGWGRFIVAARDGRKKPQWSKRLVGPRLPSQCQLLFHLWS